MQKVIKQSRALLLMLAFLLAFAPLSALAGSGEKPTVNYVALGDSLAKGTLNTNQPSEGYVGNIVKDLESRGYAVNLTNKGENGYTTVDVLSGLAEVPAELATADLITISVGANDVLADLLAFIRENPDIIASFKPEYMSPEGIALLQQAATEAVDVANVAESAAEAAKETAQADIILAKTSIDGVAATAGPLIAELRLLFEGTPLWILIGPKVIVLEEAIGNAVTNLEDVENVGIEGLENASASLNSALSVVNEAELLPLPVELLTGIQLLKEQLTVATEVVDTAKVSYKTAETAVNVATEARAVANAAQLLLTNVLMLVDVFGKIPGKIETVGMNIGKILGAIKNINPKAEIHVMGYYNALPYLDKNTIAPLLNGLNVAIQTPTIGLGATFIPTAYLFEENNYLVPNPKNIHPNEAGYAAISGAFMLEISKSYPKVEPEEPEEPGELSIDLNKKVDVSAGQKILINGTDVSLLLPTDLPEGTTLTVTPTSEEALAKADGLKAVGEVLNFKFEFPEEFADYNGKFKLVMGYVADKSSDVDIYYYDEAKSVWKSQDGKVDKESKEISLEVTHFSNYGVFAQIDVEKEDPPIKKPEKDDDKTPPVVKNPAKTDTTKKPKPATDGKKLPNTATNNFSLMLFGTILLVTGLATLAIKPKKVLS